MEVDSLLLLNEELDKKMSIYDNINTLHYEINTIENYIKSYGREKTADPRKIIKLKMRLEYLKYKNEIFKYEIILMERSSCFGIFFN
jgi:hypothetical protein